MFDQVTKYLTAVDGMLLASQIIQDLMASKPDKSNLWEWKKLEYI